MTVYHKGLGIENKARIVSVVYDVILERYDKMTIGEVKTNLGDSIRQISEEIKKDVPTSASISQAISLATNILSGGTGGYIMINTNAQGQPVEILAMDTADIQTASRILKIDRNGVSVTDAGYAGAYTVLLDMDGKLDAAVLNGIIDAALVKSGTLSDKQSNVSWNMVNGVFTARNATITNLTATGVTATAVSGNTVSSGDGYTGSFHVDGATVTVRAGIITAVTADPAPSDPEEPEEPADPEEPEPDENEGGDESE